jgi:voltage-gated sodium channel
MVEFSKNVTGSTWFQTAIVLLIILSGVLSGFESYLSAGDDSTALSVIAWSNDIILWIFVLEITLKIIACGTRPWQYFAVGWNVFDFLIVGACLLPLDVQFTTVLRMARLLRTLRLITILPRLQLLVSALIKSIPSLGYIGILLALHFYMFAVMGTFLFRANDPVRFGTLHESFLTLFQVLTLEGWNDVRDTQYLGSDATYDDSWKTLTEGMRKSSARPVLASAYFVSFILLGTMIMLNLFTGVIITSMEEASADEAESKEKERLKGKGFITLRDELAVISRQMRELSSRLDVIQRQEAMPGEPPREKDDAPL